MKQVAYYEAFRRGVWVGTATLAAIIKAGCEAEGPVLYGRETLAIDGWACKARR